jgi:hypothetical protein
MGGGGVVNVTPRPVYLRERDPAPLAQDARLTSRPVWTGAENSAPTGVRSPDSPAVASRYIDYAIRATKINTWQL